MWKTVRLVPKPGSTGCAETEQKKNPVKRQAKNANARSKTKLERILAPTVFVTVVAGCGGVRVAVNAAMLTVSLGLLVSRSCVEIDNGEAGEVRRNLMAIVADRAMVRNRE